MKKAEEKNLGNSSKEACFNSVRDGKNCSQKNAVFLFRFYFVNLPPYNTLTDNNRPFCELK